LISPGSNPVLAKRGVEAAQVDAAIPAPDLIGIDSQLGQSLVTGRAGREHHVAGPVEAAQGPVAQRLELGLSGPQGGVGAKLGVVAADARKLEHAGEQPGRDAGRAGGAHVHDVVAALGQRLDDRRNGGHADLQAGIERDVDLGHRAEASIDVGVGADHLDIEPAHATGADLLDRVGDPVHPADALDEQRHPRTVAVAPGQLGLLASQERGRGAVGDGRHAGIEQREGGAARVQPAAFEARHGVVHHTGQLSLVNSAGPAIEIGVAQLAFLELAQQLVLVDVELHRVEPGPQQGERIARGEIGSCARVPVVALPHHTFDDSEHGRGVRPRRRVAIAARARPDGQRHRGVGPLGGAALLSVGGDPTRPDAGEELLRGVGARRLGERAADVDSRVVIRPPDGGSPMGLDVHERRQIQLLGARAVAGLPDREQLGQAPPVPRGERRGHGVERVSERGGDLVLAQERRACLHIVAVGLEPLVVLRGDAVAEHVHGLRLALETGGQLLGDERAGQVRDRQRAVDRVVVGDRHEIHASRPGQLIDLERVGGAFGDAQRALDPELGDC
jgi:hypothetical protein